MTKGPGQRRPGFWFLGPVKKPRARPIVTITKNKGDELAPEVEQHGDDG